MATKKTAAKKAPAAKKKVEVEETVEVPEVDAPETEETQVPTEALLALAEEMNEIVFPDDPVDFKALEENPEALLAQITEDAGQIDPSDKFSDDAKATLAAIGVEIEWKAETPAPATKKKGAKKTGEAKTKRTLPKKEKSNLTVFLEEAFSEKNVATRTEDDIILAAKKQCPDRPLRVIGNAVYAMVKKTGVTLKG